MCQCKCFTHNDPFLSNSTASEQKWFECEMQIELKVLESIIFFGQSILDAPTEYFYQIFKNTLYTANFPKEN